MENAPPIDFKAPLDSLEIMEGVMRHFYFRALIEQRMGPQADWSVVDALMLKTIAAAEKVARYRHAQLSSVRLAGDISGKMDDVTLDELLVTIKSEMVKLGPLIGLDPNQLLLLQGAENRSPVTVNGSEPEAISPAVPVAERLSRNGLEPLVRIVFDRSIARCVGDAPQWGRNAPRAAARRSSSRIGQIEGARPSRRRAR